MGSVIMKIPSAISRIPVFNICSFHPDTDGVKRSFFSPDSAPGVREDDLPRAVLVEGIFDTERGERKFLLPVESYHRPGRILTASP